MRFYAIIILFFIFISGCTSTYSPRELSFKQSEDIKIMTFNVYVLFWNSRKERVVEILESQVCDIICLQEATISHAEYISNSFPQYSLYFVGRDDGEIKGESCAILVHNDRFLIVDKGTFWFSKDPYEESDIFWNPFSPRICSWVKILDKIQSKFLYVYNVHLDNLSQFTRDKSISLLSERIKFPCIVVGDFNMPIKKFPQSFLSNFNYEELSIRQIDHIFCSKEMEIETFKDETFSPNKYPSDHIAIVSKVNFSGNK